MTALDSVAFDIETTGFGTTDRVTVVGFDADISSRVFLNVDERRPPADLEARLTDRLESPLSLSTHRDEAALLDAVTAFVESTLAEREVKLVAYNAETWNGGFDLPFLRTRLSRHGLDWPFADLPYIDALDVFRSRFNTTDDTLPAVYDELVDGSLGDLDPFDDSAEAVEAWQAGEFESVVLHNVADIRRTRALMQLAERYCSKSDFSMKSLDPVA
jgi:uncharacterized protein YprB with RNaseH-like and TPR domain